MRSQLDATTRSFQELMEEQEPCRPPAPGELVLADGQRQPQRLLKGETRWMDDSGRASQTEQIKGLERSGGVIDAEG